MSRCKTLIVALGIMVSAAAGAAEPTNSGSAAGGTTAATGSSTGVLSNEAIGVGSAALVGTIVGLSDSADGATTATSTSTATSTTGTTQ